MGFSPTRQISPTPSAKRNELFGESHEGCEAEVGLWLHMPSMNKAVDGQTGGGVVVGRGCLESRGTKAISCRSCAALSSGFYRNYRRC